MFGRISNLFGSRSKSALAMADTGFIAETAAFGGALKWTATCRKEARLYGEPVAEALQSMRSDPVLAPFTKQAIENADRVLRHEFNLLGSGVFVPEDPNRAPADGYHFIDWYLDPIRNLRFPEGIPHKEWNLYSMRPENADIKYPWEIARCQHWPTLAQAWLITGDTRYAREIILQLQDFMAANPIGIGVNYTCTMDVGIRALNWAIALTMVRTCTDLSDQDFAEAYQALFDHAAFIFDNLENHYEVTSNHYLSNIVGLYYLAELFSDLPSGQVWKQFSRKSLETEISVQILDDGADFESSLPYHRLVTELFLGAARLGQHRKDAFSDGYHAKLCLMVEYLVSMLRPDGLMPQFGDADDGRLHIMSDCLGWNPQDPRHILAPAAQILQQPQWLHTAGAIGRWEALWWGLESTTTEHCALPPVFRLFPQAGHAVFRENDVYLAVSNSIVGTKGFGNHKHNDQLSFEFCVDGRALIVDPGSFVYTSDFEARNRFRSTAMHNTLMVDGIEQNETRPDWIFRMFDSGPPEHLAFERTDDGRVQYRGRHVGYSRLGMPLGHERTFELLPAEGVLLITDRLTGEGRHCLSWHFHCAPGVEINAGNGSVMWMTHGNRLYGLASLDGLSGRSSADWYSPSYGVKVPCQSINYEEVLTVPGTVERTFVIAPAEWLAGDAAAERIGAFLLDNKRRWLECP